MNWIKSHSKDREAQQNPLRGKEREEGSQGVMSNECLQRHALLLTKGNEKKIRARVEKDNSASITPIHLGKNLLYCITDRFKKNSSYRQSVQALTFAV